MPERKRIKTKIKEKEVEKEEVKTNYFSNENRDIEFIGSGCTLLDCVLGGGWAMGRVSNVIGDTSSNKTGAAIEAMANFRVKYPDGYIWYLDAEAAFDIDYAKKIGLPDDDKTFVSKTRDIKTTAAMINKAIELVKEEDVPGFFGIDSYDALWPLNEKGELAEGFDGAKRASLLNSLITVVTPRVEEANMHLMVVSQVRDNIGATFGDKFRISGGKALPFYASQRVMFAKIKELTKTVEGVKDAYGILVKAKCKKNKIGVPFRSCEFPVEFYYGINDLLANLTWLNMVKKLKEFTTEKNMKAFATENRNNKAVKKQVSNYTTSEWNRIQSGFLPENSKY